MISIKVDTRAAMSSLQGNAKQIPFALSKGVNDIASGLQKHLQGVMPSILDRPNKYTLNAFYVKPATKQNYTATVGLKDVPKHSTHYLEPLINGGPRHKKGNEVAFGNRWLAPGRAAAELGLIDEFGNFKRSTIIQLLAYFGRLERKAGATQNSTPETRAKKAKMKRTYWDAKTGKMKTVTKRQLMKDPARGYKTIGGKVYFISMGRGGNQHLAAGIWQKTGVHGVDVKPVLMQVKAPTYRKQFDFYGLSQQWVGKNAPAIMAAAVAHALKTAR